MIKLEYKRNTVRPKKVFLGKKNHKAEEEEEPIYKDVLLDWLYYKRTIPDSV